MMIMPKLFLVRFIIIGIIIVQSGARDNGIKCKDESGNDVDWFITYKLPKIHNSPNLFIRQGLGYSYMLPNDRDWRGPVGKGIDQINSLVGLTLEQLYNESSTDLAYILYNDQPPEGPTTDSNGHTKGVIIADSHGGFWLQHSVPHFPSLGENFSYPATGENNGQILHCLTLGAVELDKIGDVLEITKPHIYNHRVPDELAKTYPSLSKLLRKNAATEDKMNYVHIFENLMLPHQYYYSHEHSSGDANVNNKIFQIQNAQRTLTSFAKGPTFHKETYSDWIAPSYKTELDVQSWLNGPHAYPSNCTSSGFKVYNIDDKDVVGNKFSTHNDHSKWAISTQQPLVCIGDLNRMEHQVKRGGSVNCVEDKNIWKAFKKTVVSTQPCPKPMKIFNPK